MIQQAIEEALRKELPDAAFTVERPRDMAHGDYSTNAALVAKTDPHALAAKLQIDGVEKIEVAGKFINFYLSREALIPKEQKIAQPYAGKTIMIEYTDPNPFKEFHIGHLMSNAIGESIARLLEATGAKVVRANYQGDVGPHVAKALWGKMHPPAGGPELTWGEAYTYGDSQYESNKEEIDSINIKIYDKSEAGVNKLYDAGRKESLERFEEIYQTLGTKFDYYFFESETAPKGLAIVKAHPDVFVESEGATVFKGEQYGLHTRVFITKLGLPTYETKDLGLMELKKETLDADRSITVTANEQTDYFKVVLEAAKHVPELKTFAEKTQHVSHGMMRFASGKMSSRKGNVVTGESLIKELTEAARGREDVAVGAIKYTVLRSGSGKDIIFDHSKSLSLEGDSGPYLQYALVRARALLRKAAEATVTTSVIPQVMGLERLLIHFPDVVERAAEDMEPHYVVTYLTELSAAFNSWYAAERIIVDGVVDGYTLGLVKAFEQTLAKGLQLLGIPAPEKM